MTADHPFQHIAQIGVGLDAVEFGGGDQRADARPAGSAAAAVAAREEMVLSFMERSP
jgi:hypothetical protein